MKHFHWPPILYGFGVTAFLLAGMSIADMFLPRPYDGVVLEADAPGQMVVRQVVPRSGADLAGILPGSTIVGIDRNLLRSTAQAAKLLNERSIGEVVPYFVRTVHGLQEVKVQLGHRQIGNPSYLYACLLGFTFFFVGLFVLRRQPERKAAHVFFVVCCLFFLFLVCRLRPASYSWVDSFTLTTGTVALLFLPSSFLHFFMIFPQPVRLRTNPSTTTTGQNRRRWILFLSAIYLLPPVVLVASFLDSRRHSSHLSLISGAPVANWWVLAIYMLLGLTVLALNARRLKNPLQRRGALIVLAGSLFGLLPFLVIAVAFSSHLHTERFLIYGVGPLILVPITFAYAIVRFQLLDINVIVRKSLLYTITTAVVTIVYALAIALFNAFFSETTLAGSRFFPLVLALAIILLFEPLRRRLQIIVDRFFFAERLRLQNAIREMGEAFTAQVDLTALVQELVEKLPQLLGLHFAALYLVREEHLERLAGPSSLPQQLPQPTAWFNQFSTQKRLVLLQDFVVLDRNPDSLNLAVRQLSEANVELVGRLYSRGKQLGVIMLSSRSSQLSFDDSELDLLDSLLHQVAMALETSLLLEEHTRQAELQRELEIAASVQATLLPDELQFGPGWTVAALCKPARHVGGDFFTEIPGPMENSSAVIYGDVSGKSISGALVMMAAHEALHTLALTHRDPEDLLSLANQRIYGLGNRKSFVALAYLTCSPNGESLSYVLAGQPQPLLRSNGGGVTELSLPLDRMPLGALQNTTYHLSHTPMASGDLVVGYSDGVIDALSPTGERFGSERLIDVISNSSTNPQEVINKIVDEITDFSDGTEPYDDVTLVAIRCDREESQ
jgi:serine phosphatase RsbU (regulator of sigma subunit)